MKTPRFLLIVILWKLNPKLFCGFVLNLREVEGEIVRLISPAK